MIGHQEAGTGSKKIVVMNDWLSDTSSWDGARPYLDTARYTWSFVDLRGYGRSRGIAGKYTVEEAAADVVAVADALGWARFSVVGHSMSTLVAYHLGQHLPDRIERAVALAGVPPAGLGADDGLLGFLQQMAYADDAQRHEGLRVTWGKRVTEQWIKFKAERWRAVAEPAAIAAYAKMFARDGVPQPKAPIRVPLLAVTGEQDMEPVRRAPMLAALEPLCKELSLVSIADCGHYPMQEAPPQTVALVERFVLGEPTSG